MQAMTYIAFGIPLTALRHEDGDTPLNEPVVAMYLNEQRC